MVNWWRDLRPTRWAGGGNKDAAYQRSPQSHSRYTFRLLIVDCTQPGKLPAKPLWWKEVEGRKRRRQRISCRRPQHQRSVTQLGQVGLRCRSCLSHLIEEGTEVRSRSVAGGEKRKSRLLLQTHNCRFFIDSMSKPAERTESTTSAASERYNIRIHVFYEWAEMAPPIHLPPISWILHCLCILNVTAVHIYCSVLCLGSHYHLFFCFNSCV